MVVIVAAIKPLKPAQRRGAWRALCDNEGFLQAADATRAHKAASVRLWRIPVHSPDLNQIERFRSWLRRALRATDLADVVAKRPVLGKSAYIARVRRVLKTRRAQTCAANCVNSLRQVCLVVVEKKGAASSGCGQGRPQEQKDSPSGRLGDEMFDHSRPRHFSLELLQC